VPFHLLTILFLEECGLSQGETNRSRYFDCKGIFENRPAVAAIATFAANLNKKFATLN
jgi:hypothetical protein